MFRILFLILFGGVLAMRVYFMIRVRQAGERLMPDREAVRREGRGIFAARVGLFLMLIAFLGLYLLDVPWLRVLSVPFPGWLRWLGFGVGLASLAFWTRVQVELGKQWSAQLQVRETHQLVTSGPYARVRHPLYAAMFGYGIGVALVTAHWVFIGLALLVIGGGLVRVPREEQMMIEEFGEAYRVYMQGTGRFWPPRP